MLKSSGISIAKRASAVDQLSAQILLQSYLDLRGSEALTAMRRTYRGRVGAVPARIVILSACAASPCSLACDRGQRFWFARVTLSRLCRRNFRQVRTRHRDHRHGSSAEQAGVIRYAWQFWLARALNPSANLAAGEYRFQDPASVSAIFDRIAHGDVYYFEFTVPEGSKFSISPACRSRRRDARAGFPDGRRGPDCPFATSIPSAPTLEGYLFPSTYRLSHSTTAAELCQMMTTQFRRQWKKLLPNQRSQRCRSASHRDPGLAGGKGNRPCRRASADRRRVRQPA